MLEQLTVNDFENLVGQPMPLRNGQEERAAVLIQARAGQAGASGFRTPFSLLIRAEMRHGYWPQGTYVLGHPELGDLELFMVPIGPDAEGMRYEISFS